MDSPLVGRLFRTLFSRRAPACLHRPPQLSLPSAPFALRRHARTVYYGRSSRDVKDDGVWEQRQFEFPPDRLDDLQRYPMVTSDELRSRKERPRRVRMLMRDFIEDSLYNPNYGYFSKHATIFDPGEPFEFNAMATGRDFQRALGERYTAFEDALDATAPDDTRQLWHTPTELFRPYYGEAIARYLVSNYRLTLFPYHDLLVYELGAGNGTLMLNILDHLRAADPAVYERTRFKVVEVSSALAARQAARLRRTAAHRGHAPRVEIINRSIFDWDEYVASPCFVLALEVFDNFAHDALRYDPVSEAPLQSAVFIDARNDFIEHYLPRLDPLAARFLRVRDAACAGSSSGSPPILYDHPLQRAPRAWRRLRAALPLAPNLTAPEYVPTRLVRLFDVLRECFPAHKLVASDFHALPDAAPGVNAPVVQTRYRRRTIPVRTPLVHQGYFDTLFPTDFAVVEALYRALTGKLTRVLSHEDFLGRWADVADTRTRNGENPMLSWYRNASVLTTV